MNLDSVREKNSDNQIMAEVSLMRAALMGNPAVLSPNQAMDSLALQDIILSNNNGGFRSNYFCQAVEMGIVRIAIPKEDRDLVGCCLNTLGRGLESPSAEFIISGLGFLYAKDDNNNEIHPYSQRCEVTRCIIESLQKGRRNNFVVSLPDWLDSEEKTMIDQYIESIVLLDRAVDTYEDFVSVKNLYPKILEKLAIDRLSNEEPYTEISELLLSLRMECAKPGAPIYRSYYYRFLETRRSAYSMEAIAEVRTIIDIAYNRVMALSVNTGAEMSIPNDLDNLSDSIIEAENPEMAFRSSYIVEDNISCLNWEMIIWLYTNVQAIMNEKGLDWWSAVNELYARESKLPFTLGGKYMFYTSIKVGLSSLIPGGAIINFLQELIDDIVGDLVGEQLPGPREVIERTRQARNATEILDTIIFKEIN
jgi:hypothetical protein